MTLTSLLHSRYFLIGFTLLAALALIAILEPVLVASLVGAETNPLQQGTFGIFEPPSAEHPLGTDRFGRDYATLLIIGLRFSLTIGLLAGLLSTLVGTTIGLISGYFGGRVDAVLRTFTDMVLVIPELPLLIAMATFIPTVTIPLMAVLLAAFSWPFSARTIRAQVLSMRERSYVDLARASDMNNVQIVFFEIMPNLFPFLGVSLAGSVIGAILAQFGLEIIGLGVANTMTLGVLINLTISWGAMSLGQWVLIGAPALLLILIFLALNLINIGLEQTFNPRLKGTTGT
ncbi:MAG: ABC transporter permease [Chloroflexi bacterium]|nr:ABC transporter permease [Chloroflexota bacterium]